MIHLLPRNHVKSRHLYFQFNKDEESIKTNVNFKQATILKIFLIVFQGISAFSLHEVNHVSQSDQFGTHFYTLVTDHLHLS